MELHSPILAMMNVSLGRQKLDAYDSAMVLDCYFHRRLLAEHSVGGDPETANIWLGLLDIHVQAFNAAGVPSRELLQDRSELLSLDSFKLINGFAESKKMFGRGLGLVLLAILALLLSALVAVGAISVGVAGVILLSSLAFIICSRDTAVCTGLGLLLTKVPELSAIGDAVYRRAKIFSVGSELEVRPPRELITMALLGLKATVERASLELAHAHAKHELRSEDLRQLSELIPSEMMKIVAIARLISGKGVDDLTRRAIRRWLESLLITTQVQTSLLCGMKMSTSGYSVVTDPESQTEMDIDRFLAIRMDLLANISKARQELEKALPDYLAA